jgi:hypothetical protein
MPACPGIKRDGTRCAVVVSGPNDYCYQHDPSRAAERRRNASRAARSRPSREISAFFTDHRRHQSHSLGIDRDQARTAGVKIKDLEADQQLQDAVLSVHHAAFHTFSGSAVKIIENHLGRGFFKLEQQLQVPIMTAPPGGQPGSPLVPSPAPPSPSG